MRIDAYCNFSFNLYNIDLETVRALKILSSEHYDHMCRMLSAPTPTMVNPSVGLLTYWEEMIKAPLGDPESNFVIASDRSLGLLLKVMEQINSYHGCELVTDAARRKIIDLQHAISQLLHRTCNEYHPWIKRFNENNNYGN